MVQSLGRTAWRFIKKLKNGPEVFVQILFTHWSRLSPAALCSRTSDSHCGCQLDTLLKMPTVGGTDSYRAVSSDLQGKDMSGAQMAFSAAAFSIQLCGHHPEK